MANWITLADTKTFLWISWTSQDDRINLIIPWIQAMIENIIWDISKWTKTSRIKICDINNLWEFFLEFSEISSIDSINWIIYTWILNTDYIIEWNKVTINDITTYLTWLKFVSFIITYTAWFTTIPADIQEIMYILVWQELNKKEWWLISKYTLWPRTVELDNSNGEAENLINSINSVLWKYKIFTIN